MKAEKVKDMASKGQFQKVTLLNLGGRRGIFVSFILRKQHQLPRRKVPYYLWVYFQVCSLKYKGLTPIIKTHTEALYS